MKSHKNSKTNSAEPTTQGLAQKPNISHEDEKIALVLFLTGSLLCGLCFDELVITILYPKSYVTPDIVYFPLNWSLRFWKLQFPKSYATPDVR